MLCYDLFSCVLGYVKITKQTGYEITKTMAVMKKKAFYFNVGQIVLKFFYNDNSRLIYAFNEIYFKK